MHRRALCALALLFCLSGCGRTAAPAPPDAPRRHQHHPPHGGVPVVLGSELFHLELVLDRTTGRLQAYVLDDEMEDFVRSEARSFEIDAPGPAGTERVVMDAVANPETGETVGDTSLFEGQAEWLKGATNFDAVIPRITVRGETFANVKFNFPRGNDTDD